MSGTNNKGLQAVGWVLVGLLALILVIGAALYFRTFTRPPLDVRSDPSVPMQVIEDHWVRQSPYGELPERWGWLGGYDPIGHQLIAYSVSSGGDDSGNRLVAYDTTQNRWMDLKTDEQPPERESATVMFDPKSRKLFVFGGMDSRERVLDDAWAYDLDTGYWLDMYPGGDLPGPRRSSATAFDDKGQVGYLFGGVARDENDHEYSVQDLWAYDVRGNTWTQLSPLSEDLTGYSGLALAFDSVADRLILIASSDFQTPVRLWSYDIANGEWSAITTDPGDPSPWWVSSAVFWGAENGVIVYEPGESTSGRNRTWLFDLDQGAWSRLPDEGGDIPSARTGQALFLDEDRGAIILLGGSGDYTETITELWAYGLPQ